jgi:hypothetical protein
LLKLIPDVVMVECREQTQVLLADGRPVSRTAAAVIVEIWVVSALLIVAFVDQRVNA